MVLVLTGTVFVNSPAALLARLTPDTLNVTFWIVVILIYCVLATLLPIDKIIGRLYSVFGAVLIIMAAGMLGGIIAGGYTVPEITLQDLHPAGLPIWPFMFVTVACGASTPRSFSWSNQTLAMISLWVATAYLVKTRGNKLVSLLTALPATFVSAVSLTYILMASEGFGLSAEIGYPAGLVFAAALFLVYLVLSRRAKA